MFDYSPVATDTDDPDKLYIGEWIAFVGKDAAEVSRDAPVNDGFLSLLISRERKNVSMLMLTKIARAIGVPTAKLLEPPPYRTDSPRPRPSLPKPTRTAPHKTR